MAAAAAVAGAAALVGCSTSSPKATRDDGDGSIDNGYPDSGDDDEDAPSVAVFYGGPWPDASYVITPVKDATVSDTRDAADATDATADAGSASDAGDAD